MTYYIIFCLFNVFVYWFNHVQFSFLVRNLHGTTKTSSAAPVGDAFGVGETRELGVFGCRGWGEAVASFGPFTKPPVVDFLKIKYVERIDWRIEQQINCYRLFQPHYVEKILVDWPYIYII